MPRSPTPGSRSRSRSLRRQRHDAAGLQLLQNPQTGPQSSIPTLLRREPAQMSAQGGSQLMAAQCRKHFHRLLNVRNLTAGQPRATKGGRLQVLDSGIHHVCTRDNLTSVCGKTPFYDGFKPRDGIRRSGDHVDLGDVRRVIGPSGLQKCG